MRRRSLPSVVVRYLDREKVLGDLRQMAAAIALAHPEVREVRLFGSLARGERDPYADADLLIVLDDSPIPYRDRGPHFKPVGSPVPLDLIVCTLAELDREMAADNPFIRRILSDALTLYSRPARPA